MFGKSRPTPSVETIPVVMKDGKIYKNALPVDGTSPELK